MFRLLFFSMMNQASLIILFTLFPYQPYIELATTYGSGKIAELEAYILTNSEKFDNVSTEHPPLFFSLLASTAIARHVYAYEK